MYKFIIFMYLFNLCIIIFEFMYLLNPFIFEFMYSLLLTIKLLLFLFYSRQNRILSRKQILTYIGRVGPKETDYSA